MSLADDVTEITEEFRQGQLDRIEDTQKSILEGQIEILQAIGQLLEDNENESGREESLEAQHQRFKREAGE